MRRSCAKNALAGLTESPFWFSGGPSCRSPFHFYRRAPAFEKAAGIRFRLFVVDSTGCGDQRPTEIDLSGHSVFWGGCSESTTAHPVLPPFAVNVSRAHGPCGPG